MKAGWKRKPLGSILSILNGYAFDAKAFSFESGIPLIRIRDLKNGFATQTNFDGPFDQRYVVTAGSFLIGMDGEFGCFEWHGPDALLNQRVCKLHSFAADIDPRFLFYGINKHLKEIEDNTTFTTVKHLSSKQIANIDFVLPPIEEQRRIVALLGKAFASIATTSANAQKNLTNARELSTSCLTGAAKAERITIGELLARGWLVDHMDGNHGGDYPRKDEFVAEGVIYLSANSIRDGEVDFGRAKFLAPARAAKLRKGFARNRDVLFAHNATVGPVALLQTEADFVVLGTSLTYYRCDESRIKPEYLASYLASSAFKVQYEAVMGQSTRNQVPITKQREFYVDVPPIDEQERMVTSLVGFQHSGRQLVKQYKSKLTALNELKQSFLQKAFAGELT